MDELKLKIEDRSKLSKFIIDGAPSEWLFYAEELMVAAEILWERNDGSMSSEIIGPVMKNGKNKVTESKKVSSISRTYFLLVGFAIENLLKGFIVFDDPSTITSGEVKRIKSHKITILVKEISEIRLSEAELDICKKIEEAIPYWGRYPIPLEYSGITPDIGVTAEIRKIIKDMYDRLALQLYKKVKDGWDSGTGEQVLNVFIRKYEQR
jgi:hypothetical protein